MRKVLGVLVVALVAWGSAAQAEEQGRWQQVENKANCAVWEEHLLLNATVTWTGDCVSGRADGDGREVWRFLEDGEWKESKYTGEMKDGKEHGRGVLLFASGDRYEGDFKDGKKHGRGVLLFASGYGYEGDWKNGKPHGHGVLVWANGDRYEGGFKEGKEHGRGVWVGGPDSKWAGDRYEGGFKEGKEHGRGVYVWANGSSYEGDFKDGKRTGRGAIIFANGDECEGDFREGRLLGTGNAIKNGQSMKCYLDGNTVKYTD